MHLKRDYLKKKKNIFENSGQNSVFQGAIWILNAPKIFQNLSENTNVLLILQFFTYTTLILII